MSKRPTLDPLVLAQFTGSQNFYRYGLVREVLYTEGVEYVVDNAGAYWLLDGIALAQRHIIPVKRVGQPAGQPKPASSATPALATNPILNQHNDRITSWGLATGSTRGIA